MALNKHNVEKAWYILNEVNPNARNSFINEYDESDPLKEDTIIGVDRKSDDGWENVFINVRNITQDQLDIFNNRKKEVSNSSFIRKKGDGITRIGFF